MAFREGGVAEDGSSLRGTYFEGLDITRYTDLERNGQTGP